MPSFKLSDAEYLALLDEPGDLLKVYCEIRRRMNFDNGVAGVNTHPGGSRFNYRAFLELLEVPPSRGRPGSKATEKQVRYYLARLEKIGLIEPRGQLVFFLPLATSPHQDLRRWGGTWGGDLPRGGAGNENAKAAHDAGSSEATPRGGAEILSEVGRDLGRTTGITGINSTAYAVESENQTRFPPCPHQQILELWSEIFPHERQPNPQKWDPARQSYRDLAARWKEGFTLRHTKTHQVLYSDLESGLHWWRSTLLWISKSWLNKGDQRNWFCLDWVVRRKNWDKILEGGFHDA